MAQHGGFRLNAPNSPAKDAQTIPMAWWNGPVLVAAGLLPERAGQPVKVWAHVSLAALLALDVESALQKEWTARVRRQWTAHRAAASAGRRGRIR